MPRETPPHEPPVLHVVPQREIADCAVSALASFCGVSYEDALRAVCAVDETGAAMGLYIPQIIEAAAELGVTLKKKRRVNLDADHGILHIRFRDGYRHVVVLANKDSRYGSVRGLIDTNAYVWAPRAYLKAKRAKVNAILIEDTE